LREVLHQPLLNPLTNLLAVAEITQGLPHVLQLAHPQLQLSVESVQLLGNTRDAHLVLTQLASHVSVATAFGLEGTHLLGRCLELQSQTADAGIETLPLGQQLTFGLLLCLHAMFHLPH
jgi:hypothetical protein